MKPVHFFARSCRKTLRGLGFVTRSLGGLRLFGTNSEVSMDPHTGEEEKTEGEEDVLFPSTEAPRGCRIISLSQLERMFRHVQGCVECKRAPRTVNTIVSETRLGFGSALKFPCGTAFATASTVFVSSLIRDDSLFTAAQSQLLQNQSSLDMLISQYGSHAVSDDGSVGGDGGAAQPALFTHGPSTDDLSGLGYSIQGSAGGEHEDRRRAEVTVLSLTLALTHYLGGADATKTLRTMFQLADIPAPTPFKPSSKFAGLLAARAAVLVAFECHRIQTERNREIAGDAGLAEDGRPLTLSGGLLTDADPLTRTMESEAAIYAVDEAPAHDPHSVLNSSGVTTSAGGLRSKYRGVYQFKGRNRWYATISVNNSLKYLGQFESEVAAAQAYDRAALEFRGPKAAVNFKSGVVPPALVPLADFHLVGVSDIPDVLVAQHIEFAVSVMGRSPFIELVLSLLGLESSELAREQASAAAESLQTDRPTPAKRRRRTHGDASRLKRRAEKLGLQVQSVVDESAAASTYMPGVRRCGICRLPGHKVQTCPIAKQQLAASHPDDKMLHSMYGSPGEGVHGGNMSGDGLSHAMVSDVEPTSLLGESTPHTMAVGMGLDPAMMHSMMAMRGMRRGRRETGV